ncbi:hypothetical protein Tco_1106414 [Tanacetum coccineum]
MEDDFRGDGFESAISIVEHEDKKVTQIPKTDSDSSRRAVNVEDTSSKAMLAIDGAGFDWSYMADDEVPTNMDLMAFLDSKEFQKPNIEGYGPKTSKSVSEDIANKVREESPPMIAYWFEVVAYCNYHLRERVVSENNYTRVNYNYFAKKAHLRTHKNMVPRAVLMKTGLRQLNTDRPVTTAHPKTLVYSARPMSRFSKSAQSTVRRPYQTRTSLTNQNFSQKVNTVKGKFYTARPKAVNTARPNSAVVNAVRVNQGIKYSEEEVAETMAKTMEQ